MAEYSKPDPAAVEPFEAVRPDYQAAQDDNLVLDLDGFEGPIDVLLSLARDHKVDITKISILALANQYLDFIARARELRLEIAADYLVMAAWLAYLKSRLLLPSSGDEDEPTGAELAASSRSMGSSPEGPIKSPASSSSCSRADSMSVTESLSSP